MSDAIYLDHAATTPVRPDVLEAMLPFFTQAFGNPSSLHGEASAPRAAVEQARAGVAQVLGCRPAEIIFTGGGTEADNLAVLGVARALRSRGRHVITSAIEHHAVLYAGRQLEHEGFRVTYLPVDGDGLVSLDALERALDDETVLVSIMLANNEVGTIQPIDEIARLVRRRGIVLHTDVIQAAGQLPLDVGALGVDLLSLSAHKIYGPKGVGALYVRRGTPLDPLLHGGDQERGRRSGTENVPGIVGLAVALLLAESERETESVRLTLLRDRLIGGALAQFAEPLGRRGPPAGGGPALGPAPTDPMPMRTVVKSVSGLHLTGHPTRRLPGHASFYFDGVTAESVLVNLDHAGIACSSGSACRAGSTDPSHVLLALGLAPALAKNGLRLTLGRETSAAHIERVLAVLPAAAGQLQASAC